MTIETIETPGGNTINPPPSLNHNKKQCNQLIHWCFTWNNYTIEDIETLETLFGHLAHKYCFQREIGEKTGTKHLQGVVSLKKAMRWTEFGLPPAIHWEKAQHVTKAYLYASKDSTREVGTRPHTLNYSVPEELDLITPNKQWQVDIINLCNQKPNPRTVHWYWESTGGVGKSSFTKYMVAKHNAIFFEQGKHSDIMHLVAQTNMEKTKIVIIDVPRDNGNMVSYKAIEAIKNGMIFSGKYETKTKLFNSPHVIIFANEPPDEDRLSKDRWHIVNISEIEVSPQNSSEYLC